VESVEKVIKDWAAEEYEPRYNFYADCSNFFGFYGFYPFGPGGSDQELDFCVNFLRLAPEFVDLNGDGYLDLIVMDVPADADRATMRSDF